jgi:hypothetical protein
MAQKPEGSRLFDSIVIECECGRRLRSEEVLRAYFKAERKRFRESRPSLAALATRKYQNAKRPPKEQRLGPAY